MFAKKQRILQYDQGVRTFPSERRECGFQIIRLADFGWDDFQRQFLGCIIHVTTLVDAFSAADIDQHANAAGTGHQLRCKHQRLSGQTVDIS
jgi:hypothetical protein